MYDHVRRLVERYSPPNFHFAFVLYDINDEPRFFKEALNPKESKLLKKDMIEEMEALDQNKAWDLVDFLDGKKPIGSKCVSKKKLNAVGKVKK